MEWNVRLRRDSAPAGLEAMAAGCASWQHRAAWVLGSWLHHNAKLTMLNWRHLAGDTLATLRTPNYWLIDIIMQREVAL